MKSYNPKQIEKKWQQYWEEHQTFHASDDSKKPKKYVLVEFPYPSGEGLHMGHLRPYVAGDVYSRYWRLRGQDVMYPMGWDAFGLPAENYAIKNNVHPRVSTAKNIANAKRQIQSWGLGFDWEREVNTTDPEFYKWTQWIFLQLYKAGLAYEATGLINWCPKDKTGLANEEVIDGKCDRCGTVVEKKELRQWYLKITAYAEKLLQGLADLPEWPEAVKLQQANWIGKSVGAEIDFRLNQKNNYVVLPGYSSDENENFYPWLVGELSVDGSLAKTVVYKSPLEHAEPEIIDDLSTRVSLDENTVLVGHSLGGVMALKLLEQSGVKIAKLVLVASFANPRFKDKARAFEDKLSWNFDFEKIKQNAREIIVLSDSTDHIVPEDSAVELSEKLNARMVSFEAVAPHIKGEEEPEVLAAVANNIRVFTTRPDTIFGATYLVVAPEHEIVEALANKIENWDEVKKYIDQAKAQQEQQRLEEGKEKTGVELKGIKAINPATKEEIPVWIADYVLGTYGTGAIMAVPAHDERDFEFAKKFNLSIRQVVAPETGTKRQDEERRDGGCAVVFDPATQKYAVSKWEGDDNIRLYAGGVEEGEDLKNGILREVTEESGLYDFGYSEIFLTAYPHFYNVRKKVNRVTKSACVLAILNSTDTKPVQQGEHERFELAWMAPEEIMENWEKRNTEHDLDHWFMFLKQGVARAIELGYDTTSDPKTHKAESYAGDGILINSGEFDGLDARGSIEKIGQAYGRLAVKYKLRDWVFSRQRYWGEPIPLLHCAKCGIVPVPEDQLPVVLPEVEKYEPTGTGESPLAAIPEWVNTTCPNCGGPAKRETNTMPQWAGSSWYYLRYTDPHNEQEFAGADKLEQWLPVDVYFGGMEHTTLHLLYSRFWHLALYDQGLVPTPEPYTKRVPHGIILAADGEKMSKSRGNVVNPDDIVNQFGADTLRMYELFLGPHDATVSWNDQGIIGVSRFYERIWKWVPEQGKNPAESNSPAAQRLLHQLIKKVGDDIEGFRFNTAVAAFMDFHNKVKDEQVSLDLLKTFLVLLYPIAPHISEELNEVLGGKASLQFAPWPEYDPAMLQSSEWNIVIQVNGKVKGKLTVAADTAEAEIEQQVLAMDKIIAALAGQTPRRIVHVPGKLINIVL